MVLQLGIGGQFGRGAGPRRAAAVEDVMAVGEKQECTARGW